MLEENYCHRMGMDHRKDVARNCTATVLIAEDDQDLLTLLKSILEHKGCFVSTAENAEEAFAEYRKYRHDVVVLDINMPGATGMELAERIRKLDEDAQIIVMTAYSDVDFAVEAIRYQVFDYVLKPFRPEDLIWNIEKAVEKRRLIQKNSELFRKYHHLFEAFPEAILEVDPQGQILFQNQAAVDMLLPAGVESENGSLMSPLVRLLERARRSKNKRLQDTTVELPAADGAARSVLVSIHAFENNKGRDESYLIILRDITGRKKYEDELLAAKNRFQSIFDAITDCIVLMDRDYRVVAANRFTCEHGGVSERRLQRIRCNDLMCRKSEICSDCPVRRTFETGGSAFKPLLRPARQGKPDAHLELYGYPLRNMHGEVVEVILYAKDVSQSKQLQRQIAQSDKMAYIGQLAAGLAHELKNPLAIISASAQFCLERLELNEAVQEHLRVIFRNTQNANKILQDLLNYAKPAPMTFKRININSILNKALKLLTSHFKKKSVKVKKRLSRGLPEIQGDSKILEQVFVNILLNAADALANQGEVYVATRFDAERRRVRINIKDNGPGIANHNLEKIFDPFFTTKIGGTGLGLSICQRVILDHHGDIRVESESGKGTEFIIELPIEADPWTPQSKEPTEQS